MGGLGEPEDHFLIVYGRLIAGEGLMVGGGRLGALHLVVDLTKRSKTEGI